MGAETYKHFSNLWIGRCHIKKIIKAETFTCTNYHCKINHPVLFYILQHTIDHCNNRSGDSWYIPRYRYRYLDGSDDLRSTWGMVFCSLLPTKIYNILWINIYQYRVCDSSFIFFTEIFDVEIWNQKTDMHFIAYSRGL